MAPPGRNGAGGRSSLRPPATRNAPSRQGLARPTATSRAERTRAPSPAESLMSVATAATSGMKRKEREFDADEGSGATNISVVVRCRGRNQREVRDNSAVVVQTEGAKGKLVELIMGPSALSNKTYNFDRVFSQAADQSMIFDDVVKPMLDEVLTGFNCTIFAYGQTGTGKTYTMSGDMSSTFGMLSDEAGIIPRVLNALFKKLDDEEIENCVRCSFIELYNEELRDLLAPDDGPKLKIYDDNSRKNHLTTVVQGMEERHIITATDGLKWLQEGSVKRQVAATKCNDLSSRSHSVFTITVHAKRKTEDGEDYLVTGKLNLVDLAGSENIQRSGAENKRAAEAGLINKSLLTLGRVINALVDRSAHIPYRESKLTRLLQDSLGGRTKTCIIATVSPAKSNLEETLSTLEYAFRAKDIRNKPQLNALINKKTLLRDFTSEIERLKSELIATRQRNGVYLSTESYEEITAQNESRRILTEEQAAKIETLENNLRNKVQELFSLTSSFMGLKKEHEGTRAQLDETKEVLDQTDLVLAATRKNLAEEAHLRRAHQETEEKLTAVGGELLSTLQRTVQDVGGLHAKNKRKSDLQCLNRSTWSMSQAQVSGVTELVESRIEEFRKGQEEHINNVSERMHSFVREELEKMTSTQAFLDDNLAQFGESKARLLEQKQGSKEEMDNVLEEIKVVRDNVKERVGESLQAIAGAAERIAEDVVSELSTFHSQLHESYSSLGKDFKELFEEVLRHMAAQKTESDKLRQKLEEASRIIVESNGTMSARIQGVVEEERKQAAAERQNLLQQIGSLISSQAELQESRLAGKTALIQQTVVNTSKTFESDVAQFSEGMDAWNVKDTQILEDVAKSRDALKTKLKDEWTAADKRSSSIQTTTKSVHAETVRVVDEQMKDLDVQMKDLDDFVTRAKQQNAAHHAQHADSVHNLTSTVETSFDNISSHCKATFIRVQQLGDEMDLATDHLQSALDPLDDALRHPLAGLRDDMQNTVLREYSPTGDTPVKAEYHFPTSLPRTSAPEILLADMRDAPTPSKPAAVLSFSPSPAAASGTMSPPPLPPTKTTRLSTMSAHEARSALGISLREVNPNVSAAVSVVFEPAASITSAAESAVPVGKRSVRASRLATKSKGKAIGTVMEGLENMPPPGVGGVAFEQGASRRKSPRLQQ
ncbi:P-loop containing nucleoside triphosphate hydrolase protein [Schizothecium vesticola]|uniref:P-loop containing nucleoside triphosphate hydrolase protein n=1 Tax=Schizothecium vesticola TaxID=314040 RepID=A0AA40EUI7_9PEZI|nr:P-loop containing nucleoside triphosphate hydrolase protein [Schizothecium vesticola]